MGKAPTHSLASVTASPLLWGGLLSGGFYALLLTGTASHPLAMRYFAGHPVEYVTTVLFFVALAAQAVAWLRLWPERSALRSLTLGEIPAGGQPVSEADELLGDLLLTPRRLQRTYLYGRLQWALEYVRRRRSAEELEDELKFLSDRDEDRRQSRQALVKVIIWAIPMLGFLGTVLGLTGAIANLTTDVSKDALSLVVTALGGAFDTTALALALSMVLMFTQFWVDRSETHLLAEVEERAYEELAERFTGLGSEGDPVLRGVQQMSDTVLQTVTSVVQQQAELWQSTISDAQTQWQGAAERQQSQLEQALSVALSDSLRHHAETMARQEETLVLRNHEHWQRVQEGMDRLTHALVRQQEELGKQGQVLLQVVEATGQITRLEEALNRNLHLLAATRNFEDTVLSLSAAVQLLTAKLGASDDSLRQIKLGMMRTDAGGTSPAAPHIRPDARGPGSSYSPIPGEDANRGGRVDPRREDDVA